MLVEPEADTMTELLRELVEFDRLSAGEDVGEDPDASVSGLSPADFGGSVVAGGLYALRGGVENAEAIIAASRTSGSNSILKRE